MASTNPTSHVESLDKPSLSSQPPLKEGTFSRTRSSYPQKCKLVIASFAAGARRRWRSLKNGIIPDPMLRGASTSKSSHASVPLDKLSSKQSSVSPSPPTTAAPSSQSLACSPPSAPQHPRPTITSAPASPLRVETTSPTLETLSLSSQTFVLAASPSSAVPPQLPLFGPALTSTSSKTSKGNPVSAPPSPSPHWAPPIPMIDTERSHDPPPSYIVHFQFAIGTRLIPVQAFVDSGHRTHREGIAPEFTPHGSIARAWINAHLSPEELDQCFKAYTEPAVLVTTLGSTANVTGVFEVRCLLAESGRYQWDAVTLPRYSYTLRLCVIEGSSSHQRLEHDIILGSKAITEYRLFHAGLSLDEGKIVVPYKPASEQAQVAAAAAREATVQTYEHLLPGNNTNPQPNPPALRPQNHVSQSSTQANNNP